MAPMGNIDRCMSLLAKLTPAGIQLAERYLEMLVAAMHQRASEMDCECPEVKPEGKTPKSEVKPELKVRNDSKPEAKMIKNEAMSPKPISCAGQRIMPLVPRGLHAGLPTLEEALPHRIFSQFTVMAKNSAPRARMFCFSAFIDGFPGFFTDFVMEAPSWCEVCYYELPGSGTRKGETLPESVEELAEDAWMCLVPAFEQMKRGGVAEGCPFAFNGFAISNNLMVLIASRARAEFGLEPRCVFVSNAAPPSRPFLNQASRLRISKGDPDVLSDYVLHIIGTKSGLVFDKVHNHLAGLIHMASTFVDSVDHIFHIFKSPVFVFIDRHGYSRQYEARTQMDYSAWVHWTTETCDIFTIDSEAPKATIRYHSEVTSKMWKEFGRHVDPQH